MFHEVTCFLDFFPRAHGLRTRTGNSYKRCVSLGASRHHTSRRMWLRRVRSRRRSWRRRRCCEPFDRYARFKARNRFEKGVAGPDGGARARVPLLSASSRRHSCSCAFSTLNPKNSYLPGALAHDHARSRHTRRQCTPRDRRVGAASRLFVALVDATPPLLST